MVIDAGHGGFDRGGIPGQRVPEKTVALDVAQRLEKRLRQAGYRVVMTRDSDVFVPLGERVRIANSYGDAVFVCIHFNSATRAGANGIETYYYSNNSAALAANIHRQVVSGTTSENRGIRRRGYFVLRRTSIPAVLVECGFLTNPTEAQLALESGYRQRLADRIADGVMGKTAPRNRPVVAGVTHVPSPIREAFNYNDFVRAEPERFESIFEEERQPQEIVLQDEEEKREQQHEEREFDRGDEEEEKTGGLQRLNCTRRSSLRRKCARPRKRLSRAASRRRR